VECGASISADCLYFCARLGAKAMQYAMYCENGHFIEFVDPNTGERERRYIGDFHAQLLDADADGNLYPLPTFCADCGAKTMSKCHGCGAYIQYKDSRGHYVPNYCTERGEPFPWVSSALQELGRVTDEAKELTDQEKDALKRAYPELTRNTAKTRGAVETLKAYYAKFSPAATAIVRTVLINVMTDEGKQGLSTLFHHGK
jgi:hypothetical protein